MTTPTFDKLSEDMKTAMKAKDKERTAVIRLLRSEIKNVMIDKPDLSEADITAILSSEAKKRRESAQQYRDADRPELAEKEEFELEIIYSYLPKQLTDDEVRAIIDEVIAQTGASSKSDLGKVMGPVMGKVKGRFEGSKIKDLVMEKLS